MKISDLFIQDSKIIKVVETPDNGSLEIIVNYPNNWRDNILIMKNLKFSDVIFYQKDEAYFEGSPAIITIEELDDFLGTSGEAFNVCKVNTNVGSRIIRYKTFELADYPDNI